MDSPTPFPVLGIPGWPGPQRTVLRQGSRARSPQSDLFSETTLLALTRAYYPHGSPHPALVIGQSPLHSGRDLYATAAHGSALSYLLRPRTGRPRVDSPATMEPDTVLVDGAVCPALRTDWREPRIDHLCLDWQGAYRVEIASWEYPLTTEALASLHVLPDV